MGGRRPAASADQAHAQIRERPRGLPEIFGRRGEHDPAVHIIGQPGVGKHRKRHAKPGKLRKRPNHRAGAAAAVEADDVRPFADQPAECLRQRHAVRRARRILHGELADHRKIASLAGQAQDQGKFLEIVERLQDQAVHTRSEQRAELFLVIPPPDIRAGRRPARSGAERADRAEHPRAATGRLAGDGRAGGVDAFRLAAEPVFFQLPALRGIGVRLDGFRSRIDVLAMHVADDIRVGDVELLVGNSHRYAQLVQIRPHRAVAHDHAAAKSGSQIRFHPFPIRFPLSPSGLGPKGTGHSAGSF